MHRFQLHAALVAVVAVAVGCESFSDSSKSISNSISSPFKSSSESSDRDAPSAYLRDVEALSHAFAGSRGEPESLLRDLGRVALEHGISDWEALPATYLAIGAGLRRAGLDSEGARRLAGELFGAGTPAAQSVLQGWQA